MNNQEYLNELLSRSKNGQFPAVEDGQCKYRTKDGRACGIGVWIPDNGYSPNMESKSVGTLLYSFPGLQRYMPTGCDVRDMSYIQNAHDAFNGVAWDHELFVLKLKEIDCFNGCDFGDETA